MATTTVTRPAPRRRTRKHSTKLLATAALAVGAAGVAGLGTFGSFTSTTSASTDVSAAKVTIGLTQHATRGLSVAATGLVPGDTVQRAVALTRASDSDVFGSVRLTTAATAQNLLSTDTTNGLQLTVDSCSVDWTAGTGANANVLTCSGTTSAIIASRPVVATTLDLGAATTALNGSAKTAYLRVTLSLPTTAGNTFQGLSNTIGFTFDATQRGATSM